MESRRWYFYMLRCSDDSLYTGTCIDLIEEMRKQKAARGGPYTRRRLPVRLVHYQAFLSQKAALQRRAEVRKWEKVKQEALAHGIVGEALQQWRRQT